MDVQAVFGAATAAVGAVRSTSRPQMLFLNTYRFAPHSKGDDFRDLEEIEQARERDPLTVAASAIRESAAREIEESARKEVADIVEDLLES